jgi:hypothetical protein
MGRSRNLNLSAKNDNVTRQKKKKFWDGFVDTLSDNLETHGLTNLGGKYEESNPMISNICLNIFISRQRPRGQSFSTLLYT